jgi:hypothetical protein
MGRPSGYSEETVARLWEVIHHRGMSDTAAALTLGRALDPLRVEEAASGTGEAFDFGRDRSKHLSEVLTRANPKARRHFRNPARKQRDSRRQIARTRNSADHSAS